MEENLISKYEELVGKYIELKDKIDILEKDKKDILNQVDQLMHLERINEKKVFITELDKEYQCQYIDRNVKSVDYVLLSEIVNQDLYDQIVTERTTSYLKIGPTPKEKVKGREKPNKDEIKGKGGIKIPKAKLNIS